MRHDYDTSDTSAIRTTQVRVEWKILILITTQVKIFSHPNTYYMAGERLQGEEQFHSKNWILEMPLSHAKMRLESSPPKLNFLCENTNIPFSKNYGKLSKINARFWKKVKVILRGTVFEILLTSAIICI